MLSSLELVTLFFHDLKEYNSTNFKTIQKADLTEDNATIHKAFSSAVTRFFIFSERHPEISDTEKKILYFKLKIDMIAQYFSEYPDTNIDLLRAFQIELQEHVKREQAKSVPQVKEETNGVSEIAV